MIHIFILLFLLLLLFYISKGTVRNEYAKLFVRSEVSNTGNNKVKAFLAERGSGLKNRMVPKGTGTLKTRRLVVRVKYKRYFLSPEHSDLRLKCKELELRFSCAQNKKSFVQLIGNAYEPKF